MSLIALQSLQQFPTKGDIGGQNMDEDARFTNVLTPVSRRGFFGRAAVAGAGLMLSSGIPAKSLAREEPELC